MSISLWETISVAVPLVFFLLLLFGRRLRSESRSTRNLLLVLIGFGLVALVFWPSRGAGFATYTEAASLIVSSGARVYSLFPTPPQPEAPPLGLVALASLYAVIPQQYWVFAVGVYQAVIDGLIAYFVYRLLGGNLGLLGASFVIFNPFFFAYSILNLSPDQLMLVLYMFGLYLLSQQRLNASYVVFGLSLMTMQTAIFFVLGILLFLAIRKGWREAVKFSAIVSSIFAILSLPFVLVDSSYMNHVWLGEFVRITVGAGEHLYGPNFAGLSSYLAYLHQFTGANLVFVYDLAPVVFVLILFSIAYYVRTKNDLTVPQLSYMALVPLYLATWNTAHGADPVNPWRLYYFIPFVVAIWLTSEGALSYAALLTLLAVQLYRAADYAAFLLGAPDEAPYLLAGNLVVPAAFLLLFLALLLRARRLEVPSEPP